jgi:hypothetical protein
MTIDQRRGVILRTFANRWITCSVTGLAFLVLICGMPFGALSKSITSFYGGCRNSFWPIHTDERKAKFGMVLLPQGYIFDSSVKEYGPSGVVIKSGGKLAKKCIGCDFFVGHVELCSGSARFKNISTFGKCDLHWSLRKRVQPSNMKIAPNIESWGMSHILEIGNYLNGFSDLNRPLKGSVSSFDSCSQGFGIECISICSRTSLGIEFSDRIGDALINMLSGKSKILSRFGAFLGRTSVDIRGFDQFIGLSGPSNQYPNLEGSAYSYYSSEISHYSFGQGMFLPTLARRLCGWLIVFLGCVVMLFGQFCAFLFPDGRKRRIRWWWGGIALLVFGCWIIHIGVNLALYFEA